MMRKNRLIIGMICLVLFGFGILHLLLPDRAISTAERRVLKTLPTLTAEGVLSAEYMDELEEYLLDQFPLRDGFRSLKATFATALLRMRDVNGLYQYDGKLYKIEDPTDEKQIAYAREKMETIAQEYFANTDVTAYYAIIPNKDYYISAQSGRPVTLSHEAVLKQLNGLAGMEYIELRDALSADAYYRTDTHWRQECLQPVAARLAEAMDIALPSWDSYSRCELTPFHGVYRGQSALPVAPDTLVYLQSEGTDHARVTSAEEGEISVYLPERFAGTDGYDVFLGGAQALITIENPNAATDRELVLFRDSFGSSLAPLFVDSYCKITLVDLRYCSSKILENYITFTDQDVLFLYSASLVNHGRLLR